VVVIGVRLLVDGVAVAGGAWARGMPEQAMAHLDVCVAADEDVWKLPLRVCQEVERRDH